MKISYEYSYFLLFIIFHFVKMKYFWAFIEDYESKIDNTDGDNGHGNLHHRMC